MNSQDGNTRDESKMRRPELKGRLQAAWDRIDDLEAEDERLREALTRHRSHGRISGTDILRSAAKLSDSKALSEDLEEMADDIDDALNGGGGDDE